MQSDYEHLLLFRQRHEELVAEGLRRQRAFENGARKSSSGVSLSRQLAWALGTALISMGRHLRSL